MSKSGYSTPKLHHYGRNLEKEWFVGFAHTNPLTNIRKPFQVRLGINYQKKIKDRIAEGEAVIDIVKSALRDGWDPHDLKLEMFLLKQQEGSETISTESNEIFDYSELTLCAALHEAYKVKKENLRDGSLKEYKSVLKFAKDAAGDLNIDSMKMKEIRKVHVKKLLPTKMERQLFIGRYPSPYS